MVGSRRRQSLYSLLLEKQRLAGLQQIISFTRFVISRLTHVLFFFRLQLLLPAAPRILGFVCCVLARPCPKEAAGRTGRAGPGTCPSQEGAGFTPRSEIGCTNQTLGKVSQPHGLRMFRNILKRDLL